MTTLQLSTATTFCVSLLRERPQDSYVHLKSYQVEVLHHSDPADRLRDAAHFHIGRDPELQRFASPEIVTLEHFLCLEQPPHGKLQWEKLALLAANGDRLGSETFPLLGEGVIDDAHGEAGAHHLIAVFRMSVKFAFTVFGAGQYKGCLLYGTVEATLEDTAQVIHDTARSVIEGWLYSESGGGITIKKLYLYGVDRETYKGFESGVNGPGRRSGSILYNPTENLWNIKAPKLAFVFEVTRTLRIPYTVFHCQSDSYQFLCQNCADTTSEDTIEYLQETIQENIRSIPSWNRKIRYCIRVFEPKAAFQLAYNKLPNELKNLKLDNEAFCDERCSLLLPQNKLSCCREGQTLIAVFSVPDQSPPSGGSFVENFPSLRIAVDSPSTVARIDNYRSIQGNKGERIWDDRPCKDKLIAPISLLYQPFGYFHDTRHGVKVPGEERINEGELKVKVDALADELTILHGSEDVRCPLFLKHLEHIFDLPPNSINSTRLSGGKKTSDGHLNGEHGAMVVCVECKNELSSASCEPIPQLTSYIAASFAGQVEDKSYKGLFERWRIPALGITHIGPTVQFFGVVFLERIRIVPLTPSLQMIDPTGEGFRWDLFLAFKAASLVFSKIQLDIREFLRVLNSPTASCPPTMTTKTCRFPSATEIDASLNPQSKKIKFVLNDRHDKSENRLLYRATIVSPTQQNNSIYVKFSQRYSIELHRYCASKGLAPKILGFEQLRGGWVMVAMEKIETVDHKKIASPSNAEKWEKDIRELVDGFHHEGLVHGDLRLANFVFAENPQRMLLVDFDWGGRDGEVMFPHELLTEELGVLNNQLLSRPITKDHDQRCLDKVLWWLREAGRKVEKPKRGMGM